MRSRPGDAVAFTPREFAEVFSLAVRSGESRSTVPDRAWVRMGDNPGGENAAHVPETPHNLAGLALRQHFGADQRGFHGAIWRFRALMDLYARGALGPWVRPGGTGRDATLIHPAVLDVASRMRLSGNGRFAVRKFLQAVADTAERSYPELAGWSEDDVPGETP